MTRNWLLIIALALATAVLTVVAPAHAHFSTSMRHYWSEGFFAMSHMAIGFIGLILLIAVIVAAVAGLMRWATSSAPASSVVGGGALEILEERFARGEIDREEFLSKQNDILRGHDTQRSNPDKIED